jgi:hypothetical protein
MHSMHSSAPDPSALLARLETIETVVRERRAQVRFRYVRHCTTRTFITNSYRTLPAQVVDLSTAGMGLLIAEPLPVGTRVTVELEDAAATPLELLVDVINVTAQADGSWRCGCALVWRISEDEMWLLLKSSRR